MASDSSPKPDWVPEGTKATLPMRMLLKAMKIKWPTVQSIDTHNLHTRIAQNDPKLILLDSRPEEEYVVSHLAHARRVHPEAADVDEVYTTTITPRLQEQGEVTVLCYCSVGYRSTMYAQELMNKAARVNQSDLVTVYNLEGSLFKWANEKRPMVNSQGQATGVCHPYNGLWGKLLNTECVYREGTTET